MALYAIGDLHLCLGAPKPMDIFGGAWIGYMDKLKEGISVIRPEDTTVLLGDLSWALGLDQAEADFSWIDKIPGRKIILKGNHDYWWSTAAKFNKFCEEHNFSNQFILNNNHYTYDSFAICGTRGWFFEEDKAGTHDEKVFRRELMRLEASLQSAGDLPKMVFLSNLYCHGMGVCSSVSSVIGNFAIRCLSLAVNWWNYLYPWGSDLCPEGSFPR